MLSFIHVLFHCSVSTIKLNSYVIKRRNCDMCSRKPEHFGVAGTPLLSRLELIWKRRCFTLLWCVLPRELREILRRFVCKKVWWCWVFRTSYFIFEWRNKGNEIGKVRDHPWKAKIYNILIKKRTCYVSSCKPEKKIIKNSMKAASGSVVWRHTCQGSQ